MNHLGDGLSAYLDGEVDAAERDRITRHLAVCEACRVERDDVDRARSAVRGLPVLELPPDVLPGMVQARRRRRRVFRPVWAWAASAVAVVGLGVGLFIGPGEADTAFDMGSLVDQHVARVVVDPGVATIRGPVSGP